MSRNSLKFRLSERGIAHSMLLSRTKEPRRHNDGIIYIQRQQVLMYLQSHQRTPICHRCPSKEDEPLDALLHGQINEGLHRREHLWGGCRRDEVDTVDVRFCGQGIFECRWVVPVEFDAFERLWDDAFARREEYRLVNFFKKTGQCAWLSCQFHRWEGLSWWRYWIALNKILGLVHTV